MNDFGINRLWLVAVVGSARQPARLIREVPRVTVPLADSSVNDSTWGELPVHSALEQAEAVVGHWG